MSEIEGAWLTYLCDTSGQLGPTLQIMVLQCAFQLWMKKRRGYKNRGEEYWGVEG